MGLPVGTDNSLRMLDFFDRGRCVVCLLVDRVSGCQMPFKNLGLGTIYM